MSPKLSQVTRTTNPATLAVTMKQRPQDLLGNDNYYHWSFNMRMLLARKELIAHVDSMKPVAEWTEEWRTKDMKALAIIAQGVEVEHQTKIRSAITAKQAWDTLKEFYNRSTLHNRVAITKRLHEFRMDDGAGMAAHLDKFDELIVAMEAVGDPLDAARQLVILLGSLPAQYELIVSIIENMGDISLIEVKEKLLKEHEKLSSQEATETAFKARARSAPAKYGVGRKFGKRNPPKKDASFRGRCFGCNKVGHKQQECPNKKPEGRDEVMFMANSAAPTGWLIDSGASSHMSPDMADFCEYERLVPTIDVTVADGAKVHAVGKGTIVLSSPKHRIKVTEVLHIPDLDRRLLSVAKLAERGLAARFESRACTIWKGDELLVTAKRHSNVYTLTLDSERASFAQYVPSGGKWELWHARLGHPSYENYSRTQHTTEGLPEVKQDVEGLCGGCLKGKHTVAAFPRYSQSSTTRVLELVHTDVMGPMQTKSNGGAKYVVTFVDDFSRYVIAYFLKSKSEVAAKFREYKAMAENQWGKKLKTVRSDNGTEFVNKVFDEICRSSGVIHQRTVPYSPQQNGLAERMNRTIMEKARSMLHYKCVELRWWAEAVNTAVFLINRTTNSANQAVTPYQLCFGTKPRMEHLLVFGSLGYAHVTKQKRSKLDATSFACMLLGYAENQKGYKVLNVDKGTIEVSRSIALDEREVGGLYEEGSQEQPVQVPMIGQDDLEADSDDSPINRTSHEQGDGDVEMDETPVPEPDADMDRVNPGAADRAPPPAPLAIGDGGRMLSDELVFRPVVTRRQPARTDTIPVLPSLPTEVSRRLFLLENGPAATPEGSNSIVLYRDDVDHDDSHADERPAKRTRLSDEEVHIAEVLMEHINESVFSAETPMTYAEAMSSADRKQWERAIADEFAAHKKNGAWQIVPRRENTKPIDCKWVFAKKQNERGEVVRYKARLVAKGFRQQFGVNFFETYSPVANLSSIRLFLSLCCALGYVIEQVDADTAFLNGVLDEDVFMELPEGLNVNTDGVCKLKKALYGLKQAANVWHKTLRDVFHELGFSACGADQCMFVKSTDAGYIYVCLYVDDMLIGAKQPSDIRGVKDAMQAFFRIKQLGAAKFILGMEILYDPSAKTLHVKQAHYIRELIERFNQVDAKSVDNPSEVGLKLSKEHAPTTLDEIAEMRNTPFRSLIGCLLYVASCTRPDNAYAVCRLSRFPENPGHLHWKAAIRILRYLKATANHGITYSGANQAARNTIVAYSDADWGSDVDGRRSVSGVLLTMNGGPVVFEAKYQKTVALSSAEAEYMALSLCTQEVLWVRALLQDLGID